MEPMGHFGICIHCEVDETLINVHGLTCISFRPWDNNNRSILWAVLKYIIIKSVVTVLCAFTWRFAQLASISPCFFSAMPSFTLGFSASHIQVRTCSVCLNSEPGFWIQLWVLLLLLLPPPLTIYMELASAQSKDWHTVMFLLQVCCVKLMRQN